MPVEARIPIPCTCLWLRPLDPMSVADCAGVSGAAFLILSDSVIPANFEMPCFEMLE